MPPQTSSISESITTLITDPIPYRCKTIQARKCKKPHHGKKNKKTKRNRKKKSTSTPKLIQQRNEQCNHSSCIEVRQHYQNLKYGVGTAIVIDRWSDKKVLMGKERWGKKKNKLNICTGKMDDKDCNCAISTAVRELEEEFMIQFSVEQFEKMIEQTFFDDSFDRNGLIKGGTFIFVIHYNGINFSQLNHIVKNRQSEKPEENEIIELILISIEHNHHCARRNNSEISFIGRQAFRKLRLIYSPTRS